MRDLGFSSYSEYLASDLWKGIREAVFVARGKRCAACGRPASAVHHQIYTRGNLSGKSLKGLFPTCAKCHRRAEFGGCGRKRKLRDARSEFKKLMSKSAKAARRLLRAQGKES